MAPNAPKISTIEDTLQQAIIYHQSGRLQDAERLYRSILQAQPNHPDANHNLGVLAMQVKQPAVALPHFKAALEANPNQGQYWLSYIDALIQAGQPSAARQVLKQGRQRGLQGEAVEALAGRLGHLENATPDQSAEIVCAIAHREAGCYKDAALAVQGWLARNPQDASAHALLAQVFALDKQDEPAWVALNAALSINPALPIVQRNLARLLLKQQKLAEALQAAQTAYQSDAADPESQLVLAAALGANNQSGQAFRLVESLLRSCPNYAEAFANRALLKLRGNDLSGALADAEKALSIKPHMGQLWGMVGSLRHQLHNLQGAIEALEKALDYEPDNVGNLVNLGEFKRQVGAVDDAIVLLKRSVAIEPKNASAWANLGAALQASKRISEAKAAYATALEIKPAQAEVISNLGAIARDEENWEAALEHFNLALTYQPNRATILANKSTILNALKRYDEAELVARHAIESDPKYAEASNSLANVLKNQGRLLEAEIYYQRALELKPDYAEVYNNLGNILQDAGRLVEAEANYRRAIECRPNWTLPYFNLHPLLLDSEGTSKSIACLKKVLDIEPENYDARFFHGMMLDYIGEQEAAEHEFDSLRESTELHRARLDAWRYIKTAQNVRPVITGSNIQAFKLGIEAAVNDGLILEFGVRFGTSIRQIAALVDQEVHGFDSFEGLPEQWHHEAKGSYSTKGVMPEVPCNVFLYPGWFEDTLPEFLKQHTAPVRFMNIDCDIYSSTKTVIDLLSNQIIPGTVIIFDEYFGNEHWREDEYKAFQEAVVKYGWSYEYLSFSFFTKQVVVRIVN